MTRDYVALKNALVTAQAERWRRQDWNGGELGWLIYERQVMHDAVNDLRASRGLPLVDLAVIKTAEQQAAGHSDYTTKFALGCERLTTATTTPAEVAGSEAGNG